MPIRQPNSRMCFVCGLENPAGLHVHFYDNGVDEVSADLLIADQHQGYPGMAHGGIVAAVLDELGGRTVMIANPNRFFMTMKLDIKYRQPVPTDQPLRGVGRLLKLKPKLATAHAEILADGGTVLAEADLLLSDIPAELFAASDADRLGWRIYDLES